MKKILLNFLWVLIMLGSHAYAQNRTVTGTVTGKEDGLPLPGVSVVVKGTKIGTQTGANGKFSLNVPSPNSVLVFSFVGYETTEARASANLNVSLITAQRSLNEVVVVGYGTQERRDLTGSVGKVSGATLASNPTPSFDKGLAGRVTGVRVTESSGFLGSAPTIRVRGTNSLSNEGGPLYVVDGIPIVTGNQSGVVANNPLADINSEDIESIEVLKDGSSTAIYGSRASSGVVLITTKKGKTGRQVINYSGWAGYATASKRLSVLNANDFITIANEKLTNSGATPKAFPTLDPTGNPYNTDWQDVVFRRGFQQNHAISVSGGTDKSNYYFSAGFADFKGQIVGNEQRKYNVRANVEQKALNILTLGFTSGISYVKNLGLNSGTNGLSANVNNALQALPNVPVFNPDGSYNISADGTVLGPGSNTKGIDNNYTNIKYILDNNIYKNQNLTFTGTGYLDAKIFDGLHARTQIGVNSLYGEDYQYWNPIHGDGRPNGLVFQQYIPTFNYDWVNTLTYNKIFGSHKINVVGGAEFQKQRARSFNAQGTGLSNVYFGPNNLISGTLSTPNIGGGIAENAIRSFFGRANYAFKDRYLLTLTYRSDYISNLGPNSPPGLLPGGSLGWRISDESFFKNSSALKFVNDLKLRASWARTGNVNIPTYAFASTYAPATYGTSSGIAFNVLGNDKLKYEKTDKLDFGFDLTMLHNRVSVTADYFKNNDNNLIQQVAIAPSLGVPGNQISQNVGSMYNKGFEVSVTSTNIQSSAFTWTSNFNFTYIKNKVTTLYGGNDLIGTYNITRVGNPLNSFYGYTFLGVNPANGNPMYLKGNGQTIQGDVTKGNYYIYDPANPTALVTQTTLNTADKTIIGNALPTYYGGFANNFTYKNFDLGIYLTFSGGNKVMNATRQETLLNQLFINNGTEILQRWNSPGQVTSVPKLYYGNGNFINTTGNASTRFLEDGKFIRGQELSLGYTLPKSIVQKVNMNKVRVYAQVQNAFIITKYKGLDPEVSNTGTSVDFNANPRPRTFILGLNVGF
ncbi:TonB-dependent receptor [Mucilaginibacter sp. RS28]|uniref:TonB-dependent receptor n=1 Tax=Mucilaginibacter straminoryzae TaxID=2932774 RepID=A0A9X2BD77_9SPHI|nr:TonB-dependent receptor [Mucilaginibacter straminoryzae]MCJ8211802.1 TonB-dependent receptor [Mucilaginibacter straminoryzae]